MPILQSLVDWRPVTNHGNGTSVCCKTNTLFQSLIALCKEITKQLPILSNIQLLDLFVINTFIRVGLTHLTYMGIWTFYFLLAIIAISLYLREVALWVNLALRLF